MYRICAYTIMITKLRYASHLVFILWSGTPLSQKNKCAIFCVFQKYSKNCSKNTTSQLQNLRDRHSNAHPYPTNVRPFAELGLIPLCPGPPRSGGVFHAGRHAGPAGPTFSYSSPPVQMRIAERVFSTINDSYIPWPLLGYVPSLCPP